MMVPGRVKIVEVGPRDGLQNEKLTLPLSVKIELIRMLAKAGLKVIEAGSFVSPKWVPQMADSAAILAQLDQDSGIRYPVLVPNMQGLQNALAAGAREVAIFVAASETFSKKNINCTIDESLARFAPVVEEAVKAGLPVRGYISCVLGCPYEGEVDPNRVAQVAKALKDLGCYEISLGDTIGVGTPLRTKKMIETVGAYVPTSMMAMHFHDTYGQALANIFAGLEMGLSVVDSAISGLGGCPYAQGATGNVATEDVYFMLKGMNIETGIDFDQLLAAGWYISDQVERAPASRVSQAFLRKRVSPSSSNA